MIVTINDQSTEIPDACNVQQMLQFIGQSGHFAVAVNQNFVPKQEHTNTPLSAHDVIDIVEPMTGG